MYAEGVAEKACALRRRSGSYELRSAIAIDARRVYIGARPVDIDARSVDIDARSQKV